MFAVPRTFLTNVYAPVVVDIAVAAVPVRRMVFCPASSVEMVMVAVLVTRVVLVVPAADTDIPAAPMSTAVMTPTVAADTDAEPVRLNAVAPTVRISAWSASLADLRGRHDGTLVASSPCFAT